MNVSAESESSDPATKRTPERQVADSLLAAALLAFTGGLLDAFLYVAHGKVFAGAMTGNAVLCGIALLGRNWTEILHHALPILAFLCGVGLSEVLQARVKHHSVTLGLALETIGLLAASFLPGGFPDQVFVFLIALLAAFQIASFRTADSYSYNSTFITGDLRSLVVGCYKALRPGTRREGAREARDFGVVIGSFAVGAFLGGMLAKRYGNHTLWLPVALLSGVFAMALRGSLQHEERQAG
jgi:uncharacterized membrane protein YoaK (UPF0700 family)